MSVAFVFYYLSLTNQTLSIFVVISILLRHRRTFSFFFCIFFSGQGSLGNYKSIKAWPGLCNLCGIFFFFSDQQCLCVRVASASENVLSLAGCSNVWFFQHGPGHIFFFMVNSAVQGCSICASGPGKLTEVYHLFALCLRFSKNVSP